MRPFTAFFTSISFTGGSWWNQVSLLLDLLLQMLWWMHLTSWMWVALMDPLSLRANEILCLWGVCVNGWRWVRLNKRFPCYGQRRLGHASASPTQCVKSIRWPIDHFGLVSFIATMIHSRNSMSVPSWVDLCWTCVTTHSIHSSKVVHCGSRANWQHQFLSNSHHATSKLCCLLCSPPNQFPYRYVLEPVVLCMICFTISWLSAWQITLKGRYKNDQFC